MSGENLGRYVLQFPIAFFVVRIFGVSQASLRQSLKLARPHEPIGLDAHQDDFNIESPGSIQQQNVRTGRSFGPFAVPLYPQHPRAERRLFGSRNWNSFRSAWETALSVAKVDGFRFHDLRHTFASWLIQRGRTIKEVQEALGHQTIAMTMRYAHLAPEHLRAAVAVLDGVLSSRDGARM